LWRYTETEDVTKQTFRAALDNLKTFPSFTFSHGQAQSYYWIEKNDPLMFQEIKRYVEQGRWEITGGTWVESDANIPSGEALVRQYLYGKRYFKQKFGVTVKHGWYPDTFGHPGSLPQILAGCGIETYSFYRPWGEERMFWWESPDGSRIFTHRPPDWYGTWTPIADTVYTTAKRTYDKFSVTNSVKFYGVGDHGGGPTRRQINKINELSTLQMYPAVKMSSFDKYYSTLLAEKKDFPVVRGEQNSIFEGCYTSQAMVKQKNREAEALLPTSEMFSSLAMRYGYAYPDSLYGEAWHRVLFNQFHDVLAGSGVHDVYTDAKNWYDEAFGMATTAMNGGLGKIAANIFTNNKNAKSTPVILFNPLNWQRTEPVELAWKLSGKDLQPAVLDEKGKEVPAQVTGRNGDTVKFVFVPRNVPGIGYKTYWIATKNNSKQAVYSELNLENKYYRVDFDPKTGWITRIYDKTEKREIVKPNSPANQLQVQEDDAGMSAWVIGLKGEPKAMDSLVSVKVIEDGAVRKVVRSEYRYGQSSFAQDAILYKELKRIDFKFTADWHERKKMLKIAFPLNLDSAKATFDIPYGTTERAQDGKEVATQKWTDLSDLLRGVSLLNNAKYGCDVKSNVIRLTALRSSFEPDPKADEGHHEFTYALYPHKGTWREAQTVQRGYEFNTPMVTYSTTQHKGTLTASNSLISCSSTDIVIAAVKKCEDDNGLILRCYETTGKPAEAKFQFWQAVKKVSETDMMEWNEHESKNLRLVKNGFTATMKPFEVKTMKLAF
jgi:alpha-mannosidase